jgi:hypothetical protein
MSTAPEKPRGRRYVFVLLPLLGLAAAWLGMQAKWIHDRHQSLRNVAATGERPAPWSLRILGEKGVASLDLGDRPEPECRRIMRLFPESEFDIGPFLANESDK